MYQVLFQYVTNIKTMHEIIYIILSYAVLTIDRVFLGLVEKQEEKKEKNGKQPLLWAQEGCNRVKKPLRLLFALTRNGI